MAKLDESKVKWIVRKRRENVPVGEVAVAMRISTGWVKTLARRYRGVPVNEIVYPRTMGRPRGGLPGRSPRRECRWQGDRLGVPPAARLHRLGREALQCSGLSVGTKGHYLLYESRAGRRQTL